MSLKKRINAFVQLGLFLKQFEKAVQDDSIANINSVFYDEFELLIQKQKAYNGWFTKDNVINSITSIANLLTENNLQNWISSYQVENNADKTVGVIMAGNIPLVGFHDLLCVLISGNNLQAKLASNDNTLIKKIGEILIFIEPIFNHKISFEDKLSNFDAVIATGSNNTARYFYHYFGKYPHIIRNNRNSIAIINEDDNLDDLKPLGNDVFQYFGLGCRSVSKLYIPKGYRKDTIFEAFYDDFQDVTQNNKYANNYDYNKAVYLLGNNELLDNGFLLLKEESSLTSPVGVLNYEYYTSIEQLNTRIKEEANALQCIVSSKNTPMNTLAFGEAQCPSLTDYADGVDTMEFLIKLKD
jgi:hypothetical protein